MNDYLGPCLIICVIILSTCGVKIEHSTPTEIFEFPKFELSTKSVPEVLGLSPPKETP